MAADVRRRAGVPLSSDQGVATWNAGDTWSLLRIVRAHQAPDVDAAGAGASASAGAAPPSRMPLTVPVRDRSGEIETTRMFMRIGLGRRGEDAASDSRFAGDGAGLRGGRCHDPNLSGTEWHRT